MGFIRFPYRAQMRVWSDDLSSTIPVQWYFCAAGALDMPYGNVFGSHLWDAQDIHEPELIGEDPTTCRFHSAAGVVPGPGQTFCGNSRMWLNGAATTDPIPPRNVLTGLPCCCGSGPLLTGAAGVGVSTADQDTNFLLQENRAKILQQDISRIFWRE